MSKPKDLKPGAAGSPWIGRIGFWERSGPRRFTPDETGG